MAYLSKFDPEIMKDVKRCRPDANLVPDYGSPEHIARVQSDWTRWAKEPVTVDYIGGTYYGYGSELACLRLYANYRSPIQTRVGYSANLSTFYFALDVNN